MKHPKSRVIVLLQLMIIYIFFVYFVMSNLAAAQSNALVDCILFSIKYHNTALYLFYKNICFADIYA